MDKGSDDHNGENIHVRNKIMNINIKIKFLLYVTNL